MRHGKAETFGTGVIDKNRELVETGKKQVQSMIQLATYWWPAGNTALWSSPYVRACQTAGYFNHVIPYTSFHTHEAIANGNLEQVYTDIIYHSKADVLCIVGHSPYLDQWIRQWTGSSLDLKTGSMALLAYDKYSGTVGSASLLFYVQPEGTKLFNPLQSRR